MKQFACSAILRKTAVILLAFCLLLAGGCSSKEVEQSADLEPVESVSPSSDTPEPEESQPSQPERESQSSPEDIPSAQPDPDPEPSSLPDNPVQENVNPGGVKLLLEPQYDPFPLQYPFLTAQVVSPDLIREIRLVSRSGADENSVTISDAETISRIWNIMGETEITAQGAADANPATGGGLRLEFDFTDNTSSTVSMAYLVWLGDNGPFLFADENSETIYTDLYQELGGE